MIEEMILLDKDKIVERLKQYPEVKTVKFECPDEIQEDCEGVIVVLCSADQNLDVNEKDEEFYEAIEDLINPNDMETYIAVIVETDEEQFLNNTYGYEIRDVN